MDWNRFAVVEGIRPLRLRRSGGGSRRSIKVVSRRFAYTRSGTFEILIETLLLEYEIWFPYRCGTGTCRYLCFDLDRRVTMELIFVGVVEVKNAFTSKSHRETL